MKLLFIAIIFFFFKCSTAFLSTMFSAFFIFSLISFALSIFVNITPKPRKPQSQRPKKNSHTCPTMHNSHAAPSFNSHKIERTRTNKGNNKANIKLTRKHQFSNILACV